MATAESLPQKTIPSLAGRSTWAVAAVVVLALAALAGCRSASQTDLVEREMRNQEDQIYALQDYMAEYQQLLCEYRQENESLKQQMVTGQFREGPPDRPRRDTAPRRPLPSTEPEPQLPAEEFAPPAADVPPLEFDESDVPPLDTTSREKVDDVSLAAAELEIGSGVDGGEVQSEGKLTLAAYGEPHAADAAERTAEQVLIQGEVWPGDATTGPRVLASVVPLAADGQPAEFQGNLSLMLLDASGNGDAENLARWDFTPDQWQPLAIASDAGAAIEFPLQLPETARTNGPVELWVRLVPDDGDKVLNHAAVDLNEAGQFASTVVTRSKVAGQSREQIANWSAADRAVSAVGDESPAHGTNAGPVEQSGWQVARPGERPAAIMSAEPNSTEWRLATQPIPAVAATPIYPTPPPRDVFEDRYLDAAPIRVEPVARAEKLTAPKWSPERVGAAVKTPPVHDEIPPTRPTWSPER